MSGLCAWAARSYADYCFADVDPIVRAVAQALPGALADAASAESASADAASADAASDKAALAEAASAEAGPLPDSALLRDTVADLLRVHELDWVSPRPRSAGTEIPRPRGVIRIALAPEELLSAGMAVLSCLSTRNALVLPASMAGLVAGLAQVATEAGAPLGVLHSSDDDFGVDAAYGAPAMGVVGYVDASADVVKAAALLESVEPLTLLVHRSLCTDLAQLPIGAELEPIVVGSAREAGRVAHRIARTAGLRIGVVCADNQGAISEFAAEAPVEHLVVNGLCGSARRAVLSDSVSALLHWTATSQPVAFVPRGRPRGSVPAYPYPSNARRCDEVVAR